MFVGAFQQGVFQDFKISKVKEVKSSNWPSHLPLSPPFFIVSKRRLRNSAPRHINALYMLGISGDYGKGQKNDYTEKLHGHYWSSFVDVQFWLYVLIELWNLEVGMCVYWTWISRFWHVFLQYCQIVSIGYLTRAPRDTRPQSIKGGIAAHLAPTTVNTEYKKNPVSAVLLLNLEKRTFGIFQVSHPICPLDSLHFSRDFEFPTFPRDERRWKETSQVAQLQQKSQRDQRRVQRIQENQRCQYDYADANRCHFGNMLEK